MSMPVSTGGLGERSSELLQAAREGDREALEQLVENRRAELLSFAVSQLDSEVRVKESPSDIVQESILEGIQDFSGFEGDTSKEFANYLKAILRNNVHDVRRRYARTGKRAIRREASEIDPDKQPDRLNPSPSQWFQSRDETEQLKASLRTLSADQQEVIRLRYWEQLTFDEMAEVLGKNSEATRKAFYRALKALSNALGEKGSSSE